MLIRVKYNDNHYDMIRPELLDRLLDAGLVAEFKRCDGWVASNSDTVRRYVKKEFAGPDRREKHVIKYHR